MNNQFSTFKSINGDMVVGFTSSKAVEDLKWFDAPKVSTYLLDGKDSHRKNLGMVNLYATTHKRPMTFMRNLFTSAAVLEVTPGESITYDLPVVREHAAAYVTEDTSTVSQYPGKGETYFELVLSREYQPGDVLTYDPLDGEQCVVSEIHEVEAMGANSFKHLVQMSTLDREKYFPPAFLKPNVEYMKVTNIMGEYGTNYSAIDMIGNPVGTITNEFILGDPRSVETFYTAKAAAMKAPGLKAITEATRAEATRKLDALGGNKDMYFMSKIIKDAETGKAGFSTNATDVRVGPALEFFVLAELAQMEAQSLVFAKAGAFRTSYGTKMINEGAYHQLRRGKIITYGRPGGITLDHIHNAVSYLYKNSDMPVTEREVEFEVGTMAYQNIMQLFREEVREQLSGMPAEVLGTDSQIEGKLLSGKLDSLHMNLLQFKSVVIAGIGKISVKLDESLDYQPLADKTKAGFYGTGVAWTSYTMIIRDATNPQYSNVTKKLKGEVNLVNNGNEVTNTYYVKPEGTNVVFGYEQGRMANDSQSTYVQSSLKTMGRSFWAHSTSACLILDITRQVVIELKR